MKFYHKICLLVLSITWLIGPVCMVLNVPLHPFSEIYVITLCSEILVIVTYILFKKL